MVKKPTINTTENVGERPSKAPVKEVKQTDEQKMYALYVQGRNVQSIADEYRVEAQVVVEVIQSIESKRK